MAPEIIKKRKQHNIYHRKDFINKSFMHSDGSIITEIRISEDGEYVDSSIICKIRDCERCTHLAFDIRNRKELSNSLHKVQKLIDNLNDFKNNLKKSADIYKELKLKNDPKFKF